ncbi:hypothetical protein N9N28_14030 [Rubripirellula amarantea]|nr:hypothetical protein [Rubripirellula amarantea]
MSHRVPKFVTTGLVVCLAFSLAATPIYACPFCSAVSQTLRQEMEVMDAVVIASATQSDLVRDKTTGEVTMKIEKVLKGDAIVKPGDEVTAVYYGEVSVGRRFMLSGVDPNDMQWSCLPLSERGEAYVIKVAELATADPLERLRFYDDYLQDDESMLNRDAYDEFAITPYDVIQSLGPEMDRDQLVEWMSEPELATDRKRLYLTMLGVCGSEQDLPMLETMLRSTKKSTRGGLDALIACYLTLAGEKGLPLINELFLDNADAPYADTYAAIMAVRFHGTEGDVIPRSALVDSLHHVLDRTDLADLVIPDLARWQDWSQIDRLVELFTKADPDNNWIRVPVVNYLRACPLEKADEAIKKLEEIDPESVKRANTFFSVPVPARDSSSDDGTSLPSDVSDLAFDGMTGPAMTGRTAYLATRPVISTSPRSAMAKLYAAKDSGSVQHAATKHAGVQRAATPVALLAVSQPANPWRLAYVLLVAALTFMIVPFLLLTGGSQPIT